MPPRPLSATISAGIAPARSIGEFAHHVRYSGKLPFEKLRHCIHAVSEYVHELFYGIKTHGWISEKALGFQEGDGRVHYTPLPYFPLKRLLSSVAPDPRKDVFIDWGAGMGRIMVLAATCSYRRIIGVECAPSLCAIARENVRRARVPNKCADVQVINVDARIFEIPDDSTVMFFYNPFRGELLTEVVHRIYDSWTKHPRTITFLVSNHAKFIDDTGSSHWLREVETWQAYPNLGCRVIRSL